MSERTTTSSRHAQAGKGLGLMHRSHPWLGRTVTDTATGRTGILRAIAPDVDRPRLVAWLAPVGGGVEWTTDPEALDEPAMTGPTPTPGQPEQASQQSDMLPKPDELAAKQQTLHAQIDAHLALLHEERACK